MTEFRNNNVVHNNNSRGPTTRGMRSTSKCLAGELVLLLVLLLAGCGKDIDTLYGQRQGAGASRSVNGTAVLGDMFQRAGHRVYSWHAFSPKLQNNADCIVWFPDDFNPPSPKVREWLDDWLKEEPERTLIYVGRDFDAAPWYWEHVLADAPPEKQKILRERLDRAKSRFSRDRQELPNVEKTAKKIAEEIDEKSPKTKKLERDDKPEDWGWFTLDRSQPPRKATKLKGKAGWLDGIDADKTDIELNARLTPPSSAEVLLTSGDDAIVSREKCHNESQRIVVANGSFLLNLPLVNHEHRKLAGRLIDAIGQPGQSVVFLESDSGGPPIRDDDPEADMPTGLDIFNIWPTNWILIHLAAVGVVFCFSRCPIFGRPKTVETVSGSDFGRHIDAVADLLERSGEPGAAMERIVSYRQKSERDKQG